MDAKKLEEANKKFKKLTKQKTAQTSAKKEKPEGMKGKDLRKNLGCG